MTRLSIAACLGEDFLAQALHREYRHVPGALDVAGLMTWDDLNQILAGHRLEPPRMRLSRDGETLLVGGYTTPVATRRHTVWQRLHPAELHTRLQEGASLALDSVDELHPPLARLCEAIERDLRTRVQANLYASWTSTEGFGVHWDDHDTVIVQLDGAKRWRIYGTTRPFPLYRDIEDSGEAPTEPVADLVLWPGDVLYVPRGVWHAVSLDDRPAHLAGIGVGGMVAQVAALDHPEAFSALTLAGTRAVAPGPVDDDLPDHDQAAMKERFTLPKPDWSDRDSVVKWATAAAEVFGDDPDEARTTAGRIFDRTPDTSRPVQMANQLGTVFARLNCRPRWRERLPELAVPTLVVHGRRNRFFPVDCGEALARDIPGARLLVLEQAATAIPAASADEVAKEMLKL